ncbi:HD domain-containing protein [Myxococcota bacterium]|nr:HD domain-containing protein [Myxococcota bacterium]
MPNKNYLQRSDNQNPTALYSEQVDRALVFVADAFRSESRKSTPIPYLTHLLQVASMVWENGGDEDQFIAALLHDYLEDIPGAKAETLRENFGKRVTTIVLALSDDTNAENKRAWQVRKDEYLTRLRGESDDIKLVAVADKLHNAQSIIRDSRRDSKHSGHDVWDRFSQSREKSLWYYREVLEALRAGGFQNPMLDELAEAVSELHKI